MKNRFQKMAVALILLTGFLVGTALPELLRMGTGAYAGLLSLYSFGKYEQMKPAPTRLFPYIAAGRLRTLLFLWMSGFTTIGLFCHLAYAWWLSASAGMLLALFMLRDGYDGILLFVCCLFPQWILYAAMWRREAVLLMRRGSGYRAELADGVRRLRGEELLELGRMAALCLAGCAAEAFLGTWTLKIFLQYIN